MFQLEIFTSDLLDMRQTFLLKPFFSPFVFLVAIYSRSGKTYKNQKVDTKCRPKPIKPLHISLKTKYSCTVNPQEQVTGIAQQEHCGDLIG